jgi:hypothetical protein
MEVIFMGTGTSQGVPMIACDCAVCTSADPRNRRTRASIHVVMDGLHIQVDASPEFRLQCLRERIRQIDVFILTHGHNDHITGMDDLRRFCDLRGGTALPVHTTDEGMSRVLAMFPYAIAERPVAKGYAAFKLVIMPPVLEFPQGTIHSTLLPHGGINTLGPRLHGEILGQEVRVLLRLQTHPPRGRRLGGGSRRGLSRWVARGAASDPHEHRGSLCGGRRDRRPGHLPHASHAWHRARGLEPETGPEGGPGP